MKRTQKISLFSSILQATSMTAALFLPLFIIGVWIVAPAEKVIEIITVVFSGTVSDFAPWTHHAILTVILIIIVPRTIGLLLLSRLLTHFKSGNYFTSNCTGLFKKLSLSTLFIALTSMMGRSAIELLLTWEAGPGNRVIQFGITDKDFALGIIGAVLFVLSWILDEANQIKEENELTI